MQSSMVLLCNELYKKQAQAKTAEGSKGEVHTIDDEYKYYATKKGKFTAKKEPERPNTEESQAEENIFQKSKLMLEKKSEVYEKLKSGTLALEVEEINERFLVDFQKKIIDDLAEKKTNIGKYPTCSNEAKPSAAVVDEGQTSDTEVDMKSYEPATEEEEWVEYTDVLGRSRMCLKKDLPAMVEVDKYLDPERHQENQEKADPNLRERREAVEEAEMERQRVHEKWESIVEENLSKEKLHYQDVLFDEARTHGVGFMNFSRDEATRQKQQAFIRGFQKQSEEAGLKKQEAQKKKQKALEERLHKVRERKRLKMGLPIKDVDRKLDSPPTSDKEETEEEPTASVSAEETSKEMPQVKKAHVREWDLGKLDIETIKKNPVLSQAAWIKRQREKRDEEFAPPQVYHAVEARNQRFNNGASHESMAKTCGRVGRAGKSAFVGKGSAFGLGQDSIDSSFTSSQSSVQEGRNPEFGPPVLY